MKFGARLTVVAAVFVAMFGVLGIRLWFVQVAEGAQSAEIVEEQTWVQIRQPTAPRRHLRPKRDSWWRPAGWRPSLVIDRRFIDPAQKDDLIQRLSGSPRHPRD